MILLDCIVGLRGDGGSGGDDCEVWLMRVGSGRQYRTVF